MRAANDWREAVVSRRAWRRREPQESGPEHSVSELPGSPPVRASMQGRPVGRAADGGGGGAAGNFAAISERRESMVPMVAGWWGAGGAQACLTRPRKTPATVTVSAGTTMSR
jgi:hypothetical protein